MAVSGRKAEELQSAIGSAVVRWCGPCEIEAEHVDAHGYCVECTDYLCKDCYRSHSRSKASKHHKLLTNDELQTAQVDHLPSNTCTETCNKHKTEIIKFFCPSHNILGCSDCITLNHRTCRLEYIPDKSVGFSDSAEYKDTERAFEKELEKMNSALEKVNVIEGITENIHEQCLKDIDSFQTQLINYINKLKNQIKMQVDDKKKKNKEDIDSVKSTIHKMTSELKQVEADVQRFKAAKQYGQLFIGTKRAQTVLQSHSKKTRELCITADEMMYQFERDQSLNKILIESDTFGRLQNPQCLEALVPVSNGVVVLNVPEDASYEDVKMYFENTKTSQGGETVKVNVRAEEKVGMVSFWDPKVVSRVCLKNDHTLSGHHVEVLSYSEYLGLSQSSFVIDLLPVKIQSLKEDASKRYLLEKELSKCNAEVLWNEDPIRVRCIMKTDRNLLRSWKDKAYEVVQNFIEKLFIKVFTFTDASWENVEEALRSVAVADPDTVAVQILSKLYQVKVVGYEGYKESDINIILDKLKTVEKLLIQEVFTFTDANWENVKEALRTLTVANPDTVAVRFCGDTYQIKVFGYEGYQESDINIILDKLKDFEKV